MSISKLILVKKSLNSELKTMSIWKPFALVIGLFIVYGGVILYSIWPIDSNTIGQAGAFGDSFGVLTSLFSGLAFAGLIVTIWQQKTDLDLTRSEIKNQHFENVLFKMIEIHNTIVSDMDLRKKNGGEQNKNNIIASGRDCFSVIYKKLDEVYDRNKKDNNDSLEYVNAVYKNFSNQYSQDLGHYFRYLYNIFKFIDESNADDKKLYTNIVRAQLSDYELLLLFYNSLSPEYSRFLTYINRYSLLNNLKNDKLMSEVHQKFYDDSSFN